MTTAAATPIPVRPSKPETDNNKNNNNNNNNSPAVSSPTLRLHIQDLHHPAASAFLRLVPDLAAVLDTALAQIITHLYSPSPSSNNAFTPSIPPTRSVTIILRDFSGVAYTTGTDLDNDHKEIHFSLSYIRTATTYPDPRKELVGVLTHELVHCYQHTTPPPPPPPPSSFPSNTSPNENNNHLRPPGGLIEGIADFVRLKAHLDPPHWKRPSSATDRPDRWDAGYQHTAFFAWLEDVRVGQAAIGRLNDRLFRVGYVGDDNGGDNGNGKGNENDSSKRDNGFWKALFGADIADLWDEYGRYLDGGKTRVQENWEEEIVNPE
ncbi:hypothetical protein DTO027B5_7441 [Paecilomyces variotii]|nr:hypothetical protein DTO021C3_7404 [Paecilomyces variotii]KAJ9321349.1 hypothetical protein DTO027B3_7621 [Paecilomyces variotii]KAJ9330832.1 hypothetical protein DTO027B5_7441 [Paecilomyces variotii]